MPVKSFQINIASPVDKILQADLTFTPDAEYVLDEPRTIRVVVANCTLLEETPFSYIPSVSYQLHIVDIIDTPTIILSDNSMASLERDLAIKQGYEGIILRQMYAPYQFGKRNKTLVKYKKRLSGEFIIVDVIPMGKMVHCGMFVCKNDINNENNTLLRKAESIRNDISDLETDVKKKNLEVESLNDSNKSITIRF